MTQIKLNEGQADAARKIADWLAAWRAARSANQVFRVFGYAGTGKTTLIKHVTADFPGLVVYGAYTGKAARVMRRSGLLNATTIHSLCYRPAQALETWIAELHERLAALPEGALERVGLEAQLEEAVKLRFDVKERENALAALADVVVIDECSMVNDEMGWDLLSFERPILVLGDPGQLPPIEGEGFFTREDEPPDVMLTKIERQDEGSPIIEVARKARLGERIAFGWHGGTVRKAPKTDHANGVYSLRDHLESLLKAKQAIVGKHITRRSFNKLARVRLGHEHPVHPWLPTELDKVIVRRNVHGDDLLNGGTITLSDAEWETGDAVSTARVTREDGVELQGRRKVYAGRFLDHYDYREKREAFDYFRMKGAILADFGYAVAAHAAQGSQWSSVVVMEERLKGSVEDHRKWLYTAVTRAERILKILG